MLPCSLPLPASSLHVCRSACALAPLTLPGVSVGPYGTPGRPGGRSAHGRAAVRVSTGPRPTARAQPVSIHKPGRGMRCLSSLRNRPTCVFFLAVAMSGRLGE